MSSKPCDAASESSAAKPTILIVDDSSGDRRLMSLTLGEQGYEVLQASGGKEALEIFETEGSCIDIVLTDILMPEMDGVELVERLRAIEPKIRVIFISGFKRQFEEGFGAQDVHFIEKSADLTNLVDKVREVLEKRASLGDWFKKILSIE